MKRITPKKDPVLQHLKAISCKAEKGYGLDGHTMVRIMMYAWQENRGKYLAERVAELKRHGCNIRVVLSVPGGGVTRILREAGVPMRSADWNYLPDGVVNFYSHLKVLTVNGTYQDKSTKTLWTGSENWSPLSFKNDEITLQINKTKAYRAYVDRFDSLWSRWTHEMGVKPVGRPS
jgi:hypothetical protein